jgi:hypothetical protein
VLPNVLLTPHVAGSVGAERQRMGRFAVDELERYLSAQPLQGQVTAKTSHNSSHRPAAVPAKTVAILERGTLAAATAGQGVVRPTAMQAAASHAKLPVQS